MSDKIVLLPDNIANQIAAGEVIQRPASAVKELLENAVDAGATEIQLIVADAGKSLIQVIDNGSGMSETDARLCFERHATSKIRHIDDLFHIRTMGFRGEALASIAAVAQVELKTRRQQDDAGTRIEVENSVVTLQEPVAASVGTSIAMKNLFFNVPARRNFLKSNAAEMRHIVDEFTRVAMAFPHILFTLTVNGQQMFHLDAGSLKQRIIQLLGNHYNARLVTVKEDTDYLNIHGFVGKPDTAKKTRGDQYFFVNNRFIRSPYLNHAIMNAYQELIAGDSFPMYVLFIDLDPAQVDVNVHPTKQEIKFEDEKIVYAFVQAAIKHALAQFSVTPTLDFDLDAGIQQLPSIQQPFTEERQNAISGSSLFRGFTQKNQAHFIEPTRRGNMQPFQEFYAPPGGDDTIGHYNESQQLTAHKEDENDFSNVELHQLLNTYIVTPSPQGFLLIHQQSAHERVLYEQMIAAANGKPIATQRSLFPSTLELTPADAVIMQELLPDLSLLGYQVEPFGKNSFVIQGTPADLEAGNEKHVLDLLLEQYKHFSSDLKFSSREKLVRSLARQQAVKTGTRLTEREMRNLLQDLFHCAQPNSTPDGYPTYLEFKQEQLEKMFKG
ncbi:MAG: DNA mismatch repair endonuclease MutL [Sphingobacteriales bacterium]|nr:DNA mismatch repair endonuclease MutL [Sphingobacteriales bacterium]NCT75951.1 DNA mismatch repair endonuclease MutL [Chitinophagaceae bacterium]OJW32535.1 MAG: DNA mismatch repair protein MutL [Sphingobacteriales bacterium 46-32]